MLSMFLNGQSPAYLDCVLNLVDVRDVAAGMVLAAERGRTGERYILGGENVALRDLLTLLERISARPMPKRALPGWLALASAAVTEWVADVVTKRTPAATRGRRQAGAAVGAVRQQQGAQRTRLCAAAAAGRVGGCGGVAVVGRRRGEMSRRSNRRFDVADARRLRRPVRRGRASRSRGRADRGIGAARGSPAAASCARRGMANNCTGRCHRLLNTPQRLDLAIGAQRGGDQIG